MVEADATSRLRMPWRGFPLMRHRDSFETPFCNGSDVDSNGVEKADSYSHPSGFASNANRSLQGRR